VCISTGEDVFVRALSCMKGMMATVGRVVFICWLGRRVHTVVNCDRRDSSSGDLIACVKAMLKLQKQRS